MLFRSSSKFNEILKVRDEVKKEVETAPNQSEFDADDEKVILQALKERALLKKLDKRLK